MVYSENSSGHTINIIHVHVVRVLRKQCADKLCSNGRKPFVEKILFPLMTTTNHYKPLHSNNGQVTK